MNIDDLIQKIDFYREKIEERRPLIANGLDVIAMSKYL